MLLNMGRTGLSPAVLADFRKMEILFQGPCMLGEYKIISYKWGASIGKRWIEFIDTFKQYETKF